MIATDAIMAGRVEEHLWDTELDQMNLVPIDSPLLSKTRKATNKKLTVKKTCYCTDAVNVLLQ